MDLGDWMVAVMTVAAAIFIVGLELHCRRNQRQSERERAGAQAPGAQAAQKRPE